MSGTGDLVTRIYSSFRGVDFRSEETNIARSPDSLNVWKDYKRSESIRTRPGMRLLQSTSFAVNGIHFYNDTMIVQTGGGFYKIKDGQMTRIGTASLDISRVGKSFVYNGIWYCKDGKRYYQYDGTTCKEVEGYVPTTSIGRKPAGGGTIHEKVNLLTGRRKNTFLADGQSRDFYLDAQDIDSVEAVEVNGVPMTEQTDYGVNKSAGYIRFLSAPSAADGQDNVTIEFTVSNEKNRNKIVNCNLLQVFDNRIFVSGNVNYPNTVWHCSLDDPSYFRDIDYYVEGVDTARVNGIVAGNNALWVFRESSDANTTVFYHTPTIDYEYGKIYPSQHSSISTGCIGSAINFNDDIVFFSDRGMEGINGDITTEQAVAHRSSLVDGKLLAARDYEKMVLAEWEGYLFVFVGDKAFLADSRAMLSNENHAEYEWFYWEMEKKITCATVHDGELYLGTEDGIYKLDDTAADIESYWVTPKDKFKAPHKLKTTNKRGCVVEAEGDISVYAKLEDTGFELIGTYENVTDYFVSRIKRKKFKDIQLKFHSNTRFSLETATLECFIGGYIKR